jgi:hypothetical protein
MKTALMRIGSVIATAGSRNNHPMHQFVAWFNDSDIAELQVEITLVTPASCGKQD